MGKTCWQVSSCFDSFTAQPFRQLRSKLSSVEFGRFPLTRVQLTVVFLSWRRNDVIVFFEGGRIRMNAVAYCPSILCVRVYGCVYIASFGPSSLVSSTWMNSMLILCVCVVLLVGRGDGGDTLTGENIFYYRRLYFPNVDMRCFSLVDCSIIGYRCECVR